MARVCQFFSQWRFQVQIDGIPPFPDFNFEKISTVGFEVEVEEMWEGGRLIPDKFPGRGSTDNVTFERGATKDLTDILWFQQVANFADQKSANLCDAFKRDIKIKQLDGQKVEKQRIILYGAWPRRLELGEWDNTSNDKVIRKMECAYDFPEVQNIG